MEGTMKRPRMDGPPGMGGPQGGYGGPPMGGPQGMHGGPYGGGPMMDQGYGMGDQGYGMGGGMGPGFPCVKLRGLPFDVNEDAIRMFLGVEPIDAVLVKRDGRLTGEAFVVLSGPMHVDVALSKNRSYMGRRYIEIFRARKMDYYRAVVSEVQEGGPGGGGGGGYGGGYGGGGGGGGYGGGPHGGGGHEGGYSSITRASGPPGEALGTTILKLRGLPFSVSDDDICQWFNEDTSLGLTPVVKDNVLVVMEGGRPSGIAFVEFPTPQEATAAMAKNRQMLGTRYIEIFAASRTDLDRCR